jgi:hypothetical protein
VGGTPGDRRAVIIACVLKSGGIYSPRWVHALRRALKRTTEADYQFRVLSDMDCFGFQGSMTQHAWPGWWAKMELFRPGLFDDRVLYLDLDTVITGDVSCFFDHSHPFTMLSDFYAPRCAQSGVLMWEPGPIAAQVYDAFVHDPAWWMRHYRGDGEAIAAIVDDTRVRLQDLYPGKIVSYKVHATAGPPPDARLVCFHGVPKPHERRAGWAHTLWGRL